ncbi:glycogen debranching protein GlgX [Celerinatantimonas sp. YJH-8]|uniref:glycogen debranching protein GlgX n=1 Tax=Celerinatantimonas sp. YJH-8 TaxID=3228714 RepID=UPI0038C78327
MAQRDSFSTHEQVAAFGKFVLFPGDRSPLGATLDSDGCNFSVFAGTAHWIELCLFDDEENEICRFKLPGRFGGYHYGYIRGISAGQLYGYRAYGDFRPDLGDIFIPDRLLIDPYAKALSRPQIWNGKLYEQDDGAMIAKSVVVDDQFDWQGVTRPCINSIDTVLYELHVKGFTRLHPEVPEPQQGTYLGLINPAVLSYLKSLGVTSLQLMPITAFMSEARLTAMGLTNYWGYNPIAFFAPDPRYSCGDAVIEFKTMVRELHRQGLEVILDIVFNHTAEGGKGGPTLSLRGLANRHYYLFEHSGAYPDYQSYANYSGCGNTLNVADPHTLRLVIDCLRYWVTEMQVDGFRFDLAVTVGREWHGFSSFNCFFKVLQQDPVLNQVKLIAEPWDIGPNGYQVGGFPYDWHECNDHFRDNLRAFWRGDDGTLAEFATRMMGSRDLFPGEFRSLHSSVNFICYHDGFTLEDLVSYERRHNEANKEGNRDGHGHNISCNYGWEGLTHNLSILAKRNQQKRNLIASLMFAQGIPHMLAGDEFGRTQKGNNNAYCQDNSMSWVDWMLYEQNQSLVRFTQTVISFRQRFQIFTRLHLEHDQFRGAKPHQVDHEVRWLRPDGLPMGEDDWRQGHHKAIMVEYYSQGKEEHLLLLINASSVQLPYRLPKLAADMGWFRCLDTQFDEVADGEKMLSGRNSLVVEQSLQLLEKRQLWRNQEMIN